MKRAAQSNVNTLITTFTRHITHYVLRITYYVSRFTFHVSRFTFYAFPLLALFLLSPSSAAAQSQPPAYWQYAASGRLRHVITADINYDGVDEFLLVDENGKLDLIGSDGVLQWSYNVHEPILAANTVNIDGPFQPEREIILSARNQLILLTAEGDELWQKSFSSWVPPSLVLTNSDQESVEQNESLPVSIVPFDHDNDRSEEILVLLQSGQLYLYDATGTLLWHYLRNSNPSINTEPQIAIGDLNQDGLSEIVLGFFNGRFSQLTLINGAGAPIWDQDQPISGRITALALATFANSATPGIAVGTKLGEIILFDQNRQRIWLRTVNKPVTSLAVVPLPGQPVLAVGTDVGTIVTFTEEGRRHWTRYLAPRADRPIVALSVASFAPPASHPVLSVILGPRGRGSEPADVILLGSDGRTLDEFTAVDTTGLTRLIDINHDENSELLLARFSALELLGLGIDASEIAEDWGYSLYSEPRSILIVDLDQDGEDELLIGAQDGRLHHVGNDGLYRWVVAPGGPITHLATLSNTLTDPPDIVLVRNNTIVNINNEETYEAWLELRQANGEQVWEQHLPTQITSLLVKDIDNEDTPEIIIGTRHGDVIVYDAAGTQLWQAAIEGSVEHLLILPGSDVYPAPEVIAASDNTLFKVNDTFLPVSIAYIPQGIEGVYHINQPGNELATRLLIFAQDGAVHGLNWRGIQLPQWPLMLPGMPSASLPANEQISEAFLESSLGSFSTTIESTQLQRLGEASMADSFLIATEAGQLLKVNIENNQPDIPWQLSGLEEVTNLYWGDLDGDALPDIAVGDRSGRVSLYDRELKFITELNLGSSVFALAHLKRESDQKSDLLVITQNGQAHLFRTQENRPPLLTKPVTNVAQGQYSMSVSVRDVERDNVLVRLQIQDPATQTWTSLGEKRFANGSGKELWLVDNPLASAEGVHYRFFYDDGFHQGYVTPPLGPLPMLAPALPYTSLVGLSIMGAVGLIIVVLLTRQMQLPATRAYHFYERLKQQPAYTLVSLEKKYTHDGGAPDFLLYLASQARQQGDQLIASLADGLFLLADRPHASLPIIVGALDAVLERKPSWQAVQRWHMTYKMGQALMEAPSITELSLLRPQVVELSVKLEKAGQSAPILATLLPALTNLRDSERVELAEDRLVYLNEAATLLGQLKEQLLELSVTIERTLVDAIIKRWLGLVSAEIEELRGRAELIVTLKTKRLVPNGRTDVALEIRNSGRAAAENVTVVLDENPAYKIHGPAQTISFLPPGRVRQVSFALEPQVQDRFRLALTATYDDRNQQNKVVAFGDMVHLLPPVRDFRPIANPYMPGTPLRRDSTVFFGRERLFKFIAENAGRLAQRNVLILVGQRRTGKTSALLRLAQHLPGYLLPVYIDCQSLGVLPGMPALFHDLAWYIADALATRNIVLPVPEPGAWQEDPTGCFQRHFLPQVKTLLPADTTLLLVFDEFEAFENLVNDDILPPTLFTYLRHLMQHSQGLSFVFVGTRRLEEMSADYWSVLFNIALYEKISYLSEESATQLICEPVAPTLIYDDLAIDKILRVTAGHPYFLQLVCYTLVKRANAQRSGYVTISDVNATLDEMISLGEVHFAYLWQRSTHAERALLTAVAHLTDRDTLFHPEDLIHYLESYGIILSPAEVTAALTTLVQRDIMAEVSERATTLYELRTGLVGLWVAQHKSLSKLYASNGEQRVSAPRKV